MSKSFKSVIQGIGSFVPEGKLSNFDLEQMVETSNEWILTRTGISERRVTSDQESTSDLAYVAAKAAIEDAGLTPQDIDMIVVGTVTPDHPFPTVASQLQYRLGCKVITTLDVQNACMGFISALEVADQFIRSGKKKHVLVIGADTLTKFIDYTDRSTCILFADGAGACVLSRSDDETQAGIIHSQTYTDGEMMESLYVPGGGSRYPVPSYPETKNKIVMEGNKIFRIAVTVMTQAIESVMQEVGIDKSVISWLIPHQANVRIMDAIAKNLDFPQEKVIKNIQYLGNTSSASIPLALHDGIRDGKIKRGDKLMFTAFGGGLVWGALYMQY